MRRYCPLFIAAITALIACAPKSEPVQSVLTEIESPRGDDADLFHGRRMTNPYAWLEEVEAPAVKEWIDAQDARTLAALAAPLADIEPLKERLKAYNANPRYNTPVRRGDDFYFMLDARGASKPALYRQRDGRDERIAGVEDFAEIGLNAAAIMDFRISPDGRYAAVVGYDPASERRVLRLVDTQSKAYLPPIGEGAHLAHHAWAPDSRAIVYATRGDGAAAAVNRLSTDGAQDTILAAGADEKIRYAAHYAGDRGDILITARNQAGVTVASLIAADAAAPAPLYRSDRQTFYLGWADNAAFFMTENGDTGRNEIDRATLSGAGAQRETVLDIADFNVTGAYLYGGKLVFDATIERTPQIVIHALNGAHLKTLTPPYGLLWTNFPPERTPIMGEADNPVAYVGSISLEGAGIYEIDLDGLTLSPWRLHGEQSAGDTIIAREIYQSADGKEIPISLTRRKDTPLDGSAPTLVWIYGAHGFTATPYFNGFFKTFVDAGGILVMPQARGGGVYGPAWHEAGSRANKTNTVADTIAALEWLIEKGVADPSRIALMGNSAGSVPAAAAALQRPDLSGALILEVPFSDLVRHTMWSEGWNTEFGDPALLEEFDALLTFAPYELIKEADNPPPTLIIAGENDGVAAPHHAYKLAAAMQQKPDARGPALLRVARGAGHGIGVTEAQRSENQSLELAFLHQWIGLSPQPAAPQGR